MKKALCLLAFVSGAFAHAQLDHDATLGVFRQAQRIALQPVTFETRVAELPKSIKLGQKFIVKVEITFPDGWHGYAPAPVEEGILTSVELVKNPNVMSAKVKMPDPTTAKPNEHIYEGTIVVPVEVILKPSYAGTSVSAKLKVTAQMCDANSCLPPETKELSVKFMLDQKNGDLTPEQKKRYHEAKKARKEKKEKKKQKVGK